MGIGVNFPGTITVLEQLDPTDYGASTNTTGWWEVTNSASITAIVGLGVMTTSSTVDVKLEQASDSSGTGAKDLKTLTQLTEAGSDDSKAVHVTANYSDLDLTNSFSHVRLSVTVATAASLAYGLLLQYWTSRPQMSRLDGTFVAESQ